MPVRHLQVWQILPVLVLQEVVLARSWGGPRVTLVPQQEWQEEPADLQEVQ